LTEAGQIYFESAKRIVEDARLAQRWTLEAQGRQAEVALSSSFAINSVGIILVPEEIVADDLAAGALERILPA
jgi:DNA-binding transcriptional LysR family regulator